MKENHYHSIFCIHLFNQLRGILSMILICKYKHELCLYYAKIIGVLIPAILVAKLSSLMHWRLGVL